MQRTLYWLLGSVAACPLCVAILIGLFDWNWLRAPVVVAGASGSGRRFAIDRIDGEWAWRPRLRINGVMSSRLILLDTVDTALTVEGEANLADETLNLQANALPKDTSLLSARSPIHVGGLFAAPTVGIDAGQLEARIAGAVALGVLLTPLAAILAFIDPSLTGDSDCGELLRENPIKQ